MPLTSLLGIPSDCSGRLVGGGCPLLIGVAAALDDDVALLFVDGHLDFYDDSSSPTGEAAGPL